MSQDDASRPLSPEELAAETGAALPDKEVISLLDLNADHDIGLDAAAPIDLAVAANANVAAPIDASVGANVLSVGSTAQALSDQGVMIDQNLTGDAIAHAPQDSTIDQAADPTAADAPAADTTATDPAAAATGIGDVHRPAGRDHHAEPGRDRRRDRRPDLHHHPVTGALPVARG